MVANIELPPDLRDYILDYQHKAKKEKQVGQYSIEKAIISMIYEHKELTETVAILKEQLAELKKR